MADFLSSQPGDYRIYSIHYDPPYGLSAELGIERIDGILTFQLAHSVDIARVASGCSLTGYAVGFPPCLSGEIDLDAYQTARPEPAVLGLLNVRYVTADFDLNVPDLEPVLVDGDVTIYENRRFLPRAFLAESVEMAPPDGNLPMAYDLEGHGNIRLDSHFEYSWDIFNRMTVAADAGFNEEDEDQIPQSVTYLYDAMGRRVARLDCAGPDPP